jgi:(S)-ureidoglycine---glyoxylate transaminase
MGSGPSNPEPSVLRALAAPPLAADDPVFETFVDDLGARLRRVFGAGNARALVVPGASRAGVEAVLASVVEPGDRVTVGAYGHFGELLCSLVERHGGALRRIDAAWGEAIDPDRVAAELRRAPPKVFAVVHADTSTGILQPLEEIGRVCREVGTLLVVDAVLSLGGCELRVAEWSIDAAMGGAQKCLGGPPGLGPVVYSDRFRRTLTARREPPHSAYLDLRRLERQPRSTPLLFGLREALRIVEEEGFEARWDRHRRAGGALVAGIEAMGLETFGDRARSAPMITLVRVPEGVIEAGVREQLLAEHGVEIMAAFGQLRGRVWRIGTMGTNACLPSVLQVLAALEAVLSARGLRIQRGVAVDAARAAFQS